MAGGNIQWIMNRICASRFFQELITVGYTFMEARDLKHLKKIQKWCLNF